MDRFELLKTERIYQGHLFTLESIQARLPDGKVRSFDLVRHPGAVVILPYDEQGRIWFVRQYRLGADQTLLELPAGVINPGEDPAECAAREVREEVGLAARRIEKLGNFYLAPGYSSEYMHIFLARDLYPARLPGDEDEFLQAEPIAADEAFRMARNGEIHDGKTLATLLLAQDHLG